MTEGSELRDVLGTPESPVIIADEQLRKRGQRARAQLRCVKFLQELGMNRFLYDDLWGREFQLVAHEHLLLDEINLTENPFPLAHIVTSKQLQSPDELEFKQEFISQAEQTWELFKTASGSPATDGRYIVVTDTVTPYIPSETPVPGRPVSDQFSIPVFEYEQLIHDYVKENVDSKIPLTATKNLYFHRISEHHKEHGAPASNLVELFDYEQAPADSPVWDPLFYFISEELDKILEEYRAHVTDALRSWIEWGDTGEIAKWMIRTLQRCNFNVEQLEEYQNETRRLKS